MGDDTGKVPCALVVMGVSGSGKSTIADKLAERLDWTYEDGDQFHPASNIAKMSAGQPLTDEDRWPWLKAIADEIADVAILLFEFADNLGLNLVEQMEAKLTRNEARYPAEKARGSNRKYNEL